VLMWLFYAAHPQPLLYKSEHIDAARSAEHQVAYAEIETRFEQTHAARRDAMEELATASTPEGRAAATERIHAYDGAVHGLRREARTLLGGRTDAAGRPADDADTNYIFCRFILDNLPPALLGLIIAAIFAAAMSSIDSTLNALSGATVVDLYRRWIVPDCSETHALRAGRILTLVWGGIATFTALFFAGGGSVIELINKVGSFFYGSLLGIFALALLVRRAGPVAGLCGLVAGMVAVLVVWQTVKIEFLWFNVIGCLAVLLVGGLVARFERARAA